MFDSPVPDEELPDALDVAQRLCEAPWDDLVDEVKLTFVTRAQQYIDVIAPPILEQRDRARAWAVELEQRQHSPEQEVQP